MTPDDYLETLLDEKLAAETEVETQPEPDSATESTDSNDDKNSVNYSKQLRLKDLEQLVEE